MWCRGACEPSAKAAAIYIRRRLRVSSASLFFVPYLEFNSQDFTCELPSTGRHFPVRGEEGPGPRAPLAVLLRWISEVLPHYDLRVHHEGSVNFCEDEQNKQKKDALEDSFSSSSSSSLDAWGWRTSSWRRSVAEWPSANVSSASSRLSLWWPFNQRVTTFRIEHKWHWTTRLSRHFFGCFFNRVC